MSELIKIREISLKYDVSARALKYYEDMGLITSARSEDYAYRMYDEAAVKRIEQILILRKLNISIKDIQRIFSTSGSEIVLEVLGKKVDAIDEEVSLLHELKEIVLEFIREIKEADFSNDSDVLWYKRCEWKTPKKHRQSKRLRHKLAVTITRKEHDHEQNQLHPRRRLPLTGHSALRPA